MKTLKLLLPVLALATVAYVGGWDGGFVWDDHYSIEQGQLIRDPRNLGRLLLTDAWANPWPDQSRASSAANIYRPLQTASFLVSWQLYGGDPTGYHVENTLLHLLCVALVFGVWRRLRGDPAEAAWAAAIFAVLPVNAEAVAWISGRSDPLLTALLLAAFAVHVRSRRLTVGAAAPWVAGLVVLYAMALLVKESSVVLPVLLLTYELLLARDRLPWSRCLLRIAWLAVPFCAYMGLRTLVLGKAEVVAGSLGLGPLVLQTVPVVATYLSWVLVPHTLTVARAWSPPHSAIQVGVTAAGLLVVIGFVVWRWRRVRPAPTAFALTWFVVALSPAVLLTLSSGAMAERFLYLPAVGVAWWLGGAARGFTRWFLHIGRGTLARALLGVILALLLFRTAVRTEDWDNDFLLYMSAVQEEPFNAHALYRLGTHLAEQGEIAASAKLLKQASDLAPFDTQIASNLAVVLRRRGTPEMALHALHRALPYAGRDARYHYNLALVEMDLGHARAALHHLDLSLAIAPEYHQPRQVRAGLRAWLKDNAVRTKRRDGELGH